MIRERRILSPGEPRSAPGEVPEESGGEGRAGSWEQGAGSMERTEGRERRQAREVCSQGSTQECTPAILSDSNRIVKHQVRTPKLGSYLKRNLCFFGLILEIAIFKNTKNVLTLRFMAREFARDLFTTSRTR